MQNRQERLAALNGESRVFVCADCGRVKHIKDAGARMGRSANIVCVACIVGAWRDRHLGIAACWHATQAIRLIPMVVKPNTIT